MSVTSVVRIALISLLIQLLAGCFGGGVFTAKECESAVPLCDYNYMPDKWGPIEGKKGEEPQPNFLPAKDEFLRIWGEPTESIRLSEDEVTFVYKHQGEWCGAAAFWVVIPVPLMLLACDAFDRITFKGEHATRVHFRRIDSAGAFIGPGIGGSGWINPCPKPCPNGIKTIKSPEPQ